MKLIRIGTKVKFIKDWNCDFSGYKAGQTARLIMYRGDNIWDSELVVPLKGEEERNNGWSARHLFDERYIKVMYHKIKLP